MDSKSFAKVIRVGDSVRLRSDLVVDTLYGDQYYYVDKMAKPGSVVKVKELVDDNTAFIIEGEKHGTYWYYSAEMVQEIMRPSADTTKPFNSSVSEEMEDREVYIYDLKDKANISEAKLQVFLVDNLEKGDVVKIWDSSAQKLAGRTAKITQVFANCYELDKDPEADYYVGSFNTWYTITRNEHIFQAFVEKYDKSEKKEATKPSEVKTKHSEIKPKSIEPAISASGLVRIDTSVILKEIDRITAELATLRKAFEKMS